MFRARPHLYFLRIAVLVTVFIGLFAAGSGELRTVDVFGNKGALIGRVSAAAPMAGPTNDNFANAQPILGAAGTINDSNVGATKEVNEPNHANNSGGQSVWYRWQAPSNGRFTFSTQGSDFNTVMAVYTGNNLPGTPVASNDNEPFPCFSEIYSRVSFEAVGGVVYHIVVDRTPTAVAGNIKLRWARGARINGRITDVSGRPAFASTVTLDGSVCRRTEVVGGILFNDVPIGGSYFINIQNGSFGNFAPYGATGSTSPLTGDVTINFYQSTPAYSISGLVTMPGGDISGLTVNCVSTNGGIINYPANITAGGFFTCAGLPVAGDYVITPSKLGFRFTPTNRTVTFLFSHTSIPPFTGAGPLAYTISGRVTNSGGAGVNGISVSLSGSLSASQTTNANGDYSFTNVLEGGSYAITPFNPNYTFNPPNRAYSNLTANQTANFTASFVLQLLLDEAGQVAALDSLLLLRDPFQVVNNGNLLNRGVDRNTRVTVFVANLSLLAGETPAAVVVNLIGSNSQSYDIPAEDVRPVAGVGFAQVIFRLPDTLSAGTCTLIVKAHGLGSNVGAMRIRN